MSNNYSANSGSGDDGYRDSGYGDDSSGYRGSYRGRYRGRGRGGYRGRGNDRGGYYGRGGYLSRYNPHYGSSSSRGRGAYSSYQGRDNYRGDKYDGPSRPTSQSDEGSSYYDNYQDGYQEGYYGYGDDYGGATRPDEGSYGYPQSLYRGSYTGGYRGTYVSKDRGSYHGRSQYESSEHPHGSHLGWGELTTPSPASKPKTSQYKSAPGTRAPANPWITILQIKDDTTKQTLEYTHEELGRLDKELHELQHGKLLLENSVTNLERQAHREELHVQITNEKLEEFTYL